MEALEAGFRRLNTTDEEKHGLEAQGLLDITALTDRATRLTKTLIKCSQSLSARLDADSQRPDRLVAEISRAFETCGTLKNAVSSWESAAVQAVWTLINQDCQSQERLLHHFESEIKTTIVSVLGQSGSHEYTLRMVLELCYQEASSREGNLHSQIYLDELEESVPELPFDPDYESEEYYEHENRLQVDEGYAQSERTRQEQTYANRLRTREDIQQSWQEFWFRKKEACDPKPTLFRAFTSSGPSHPHLLHLPPYLIRVADSCSSGMTNEHVVASAASVAEHCEVDLCQTTPEEAAERLHAHLTKGLWYRVKQGKGNLMSWTSSLLFAIQYAIYRCNEFGSLPKDVKFCVIDVRKFPCGQFTRDTWLIEEYYEQNDGLKDLWRLRQGSDYDNGEHLSQGTVFHHGRSCVFSLEDLKSAGLYRLYPEFDDPSERKKWTKRVRDLRREWNDSQPTTLAEIQTTLNIARHCFKGVDPLEISVLLLSLKNRERNLRMEDSDRVVGTKHKPSEVQRYLDSIGEGGQDSLPISPDLILQDMYDFSSE